MERNDEEIYVLTYNRHTRACHRFGSLKGLEFGDKRTDVENSFQSFVTSK